MLCNGAFGGTDGGMMSKGRTAMKLISLEELERQISLRCRIHDERSVFVTSVLYDALQATGIVPVEKLADEIRAYCDAAETCPECPFFRGFCKFSDGGIPSEWEV